MTKGTKFSCLLAIISLGTLHVFAFPIRIFFTKKSKYVSSYVMVQNTYFVVSWRLFAKFLIRVQKGSQLQSCFSKLESLLFLVVMLLISAASQTLFENRNLFLSLSVVPWMKLEKHSKVHQYSIGEQKMSVEHLHLLTLYPISRQYKGENIAIHHLHIAAANSIIFLLQKLTSSPPSKGPP